MLNPCPSSSPSLRPPARLPRRQLLLAGLGLPWLPHARADNAPSSAPSSEQLGRWIQQAENALRGDSSAVMAMKVKTSRFERDYDLLVMSDDRGGTAKVLIRMLGPALWRGNATLKVGDRISFFDPRTSRITVMGSSMLADNWMGSHFTNDDLLRETDLARHYRYEALENRSSNAGDGGEPAVAEHLIRLTPLPDAPVAWGKVHYRLQLGSDTRALPVQLDYYRRADDAQPARTLRYSEPRLLGERRLPSRMTMTLADKPGEFTQIDYRKLRFDAQFGADDFSERALR